MKLGEVGNSVMVDFREAIRKSPLEFKLNKISQCAFEQWKSKSISAYGYNPFTNESINAATIIQDYTKKLVDALKTLVYEKLPKEKSRGRSYSYGFVCGYMQSALDLLWYDRYFIENSQEYKDLMKVKAIIEYLRINRQAAGVVHFIYKSLNRQGSGAEDFSVVTHPNVVQLQGKNNSVNREDMEFCKAITNYLEDDLRKKYLDLLNRQLSCYPDIDDYLTQEDIEALVCRVTVS